MRHPAQGAGVVRTEMEDPSARGYVPGEEDADSEPSVDEHGDKLQDVDVQHALWERLVAFRLGGEDGPAEGSEVRGGYAPFEVEGGAPSAQTFVGRVGEGCHVWGPGDEEANRSRPYGVRRWAKKELSDILNVARHR